MKYLAEVEAVQWKDTDESWDEVVELYQGVETVAFRTDDGGISVETEDGREQGAYRLLGGQERHGRHQPGGPRRVQLVICSDADRVVRPTRAGSQPCWLTMLSRGRAASCGDGPKA